MPLPKMPLNTQLPSRQLISGTHINAFNDLFQSFQGGIVALAGGGRPNSPVLNAANVELATVATGADSVQLPPAIVGLTITVTNSGAASAQIFGNGSDTIQSGATTNAAGSVGVALAAASTAMFRCTKTGVWKRFLGA